MHYLEEKSPLSVTQSPNDLSQVATKLFAGNSFRRWSTDSEGSAWDWRRCSYRNCRHFVRPVLSLWAIHPSPVRWQPFKCLYSLPFHLRFSLD